MQMMRGVSRLNMGVLYLSDDAATLIHSLQSWWVRVAVQMEMWLHQVRIGIRVGVCSGPGSMELEDFHQFFGERTESLTD